METELIVPNANFEFLTLTDEGQVVIAIIDSMNQSQFRTLRFLPQAIQVEIALLSLDGGISQFYLLDALKNLYIVVVVSSHSVQIEPFLQGVIDFIPLVAIIDNGTVVTWKRRHLDILHQGSKPALTHFTSLVRKPRKCVGYGEVFDRSSASMSGKIYYLDDENCLCQFSLSDPTTPGEIFITDGQPLQLDFAVIGDNWEMVRIDGISNNRYHSLLPRESNGDIEDIFISEIDLDIKNVVNMSSTRQFALIADKIYYLISSPLRLVALNLSQPVTKLSRDDHRVLFQFDTGEWFLIHEYDSRRNLMVYYHVPNVENLYLDGKLPHRKRIKSANS